MSLLAMLPQFFTMPIYYTCHSILISRFSPVKSLELEMISHLQSGGNLVSLLPASTASSPSAAGWWVSQAQMPIPTCISPLVYHFCEARSSNRQTSRWDSVCADFIRENSFDVNLWCKSKFLWWPKWMGEEKKVGWQSPRKPCTI